MRAADSAPAQARILVVEDDRDIAGMVTHYLRGNELECASTGDSTEMDRAIAAARPDLIVLDVNLPGEDGFDICVRLRRTCDIPIIMLTARAEDIDRIIGIELGADDYLTKPFNPRELLARIRAVLRRHSTHDNSPAAQAFVFEGWRMNLMARELHDPAGALVMLTAGEFDLLRILCASAGHVLSREKLVTETQAGGLNRGVDVLISRLRHKIEPEAANPRIIRTVRSAGYQFTAKVDPQ